MAFQTISSSISDAESGIMVETQSVFLHYRAEAHALIMQGFHLAQSNIDDMVAMADSNQNGYHRVEEGGQRKLFFEEKQVAVVCDIDDTLVDGVHYTANAIGSNGEWTNKAFTDFVQSTGCTALPGAVQFANHCVDNGIALFYVTNRYDQGYKLSEEGYGGQEGYKKNVGAAYGNTALVRLHVTLKA